MDEIRLHHLKTCGAFHDVEVNRYSDSDKTLFIVKRYKPTGTYMEMDNRYKPGEYGSSLMYRGTKLTGKIAGG